MHYRQSCYDFSCFPVVHRCLPEIEANEWVSKNLASFPSDELEGLARLHHIDAHRDIESLVETRDGGQYPGLSIIDLHDCILNSSKETSDGRCL